MAAMNKDKDNNKNRGKVFTINEFKLLLTAVWVASMAPEAGGPICFADWLILAFCAKTFLLGALRTEQFERFRAGGVRSITFYDSNRDDEGNLHPIRALEEHKAQPEKRTRVE